MAVATIGHVLAGEAPRQVVVGQHDPGGAGPGGEVAPFCGMREDPLGRLMDSGGLLRVDLLALLVDDGVVVWAADPTADARADHCGSEVLTGQPFPT